MIESLKFQIEESRRMFRLLCETVVSRTAIRLCGSGSPPQGFSNYAHPPLHADRIRESHIRRFPEQRRALLNPHIVEEIFEI